MRKPQSRYRPSLTRLEHLTRLLDDAFVIPGTKIRIGLDGMVGLIPGIGDLIMAGVGCYIVIESVRLGAPWHLPARMLLNLITEGIVGSVPVIGDAFDITFRTNRRNLNILNKWLEKTGHQGSRQLE